MDPKTLRKLVEKVCGADREYGTSGKKRFLNNDLYRVSIYLANRQVGDD